MRRACRKRALLTRKGSPPPRDRSARRTFHTHRLSHVNLRHKVLVPLVMVSRDLFIPDFLQSAGELVWIDTSSAC